jgi:TIR domain
MAVDSFFCYAYEDRHLSGEIKRQLEGYGFDVFLAHDDIDPSIQWQEEILQHLGECEVFIALLTEAFDDSNWIHQEIGIAFARRPHPIMVPINAGRVPVGYLGRFQAIRLDPNRLDERERPSWGSTKFTLSYLDTLCLRVVRSVASQSQQIGSEVRTALIENIRGIFNFDGAGFEMWKLSEIGGLSEDEINRVLEVATVRGRVTLSGLSS